MASDDEGQFCEITPTCSRSSIAWYDSTTPSRMEWDKYSRCHRYYEYAGGGYRSLTNTRVHSNIRSFVSFQLTRGFDSANLMIVDRRSQIWFANRRILSLSVEHQVSDLSGMSIEQMFVTDILFRESSLPMGAPRGRGWTSRPPIAPQEYGERERAPSAEKESLKTANLYFLQSPRNAQMKFRACFRSERVSAGIVQRAG